jgi:hypothetical protein
MSDDIVDKLIYTLNAEQSRTAHYLERAERAEAELQRIRDSDDTSSGRQRELLRSENAALRALLRQVRHHAPLPRGLEDAIDAALREGGK